MLVLEDVTRRTQSLIRGPGTTDQLDYEHVRVALISLAHYHGAAWRWLSVNKNEKMITRSLTGVPKYAPHVIGIT